MNIISPRKKATITAVSGNGSGSGGAEYSIGAGAKAFEVNNPDFDLSPYTGMTRKHYIDCAKYVLERAFKHVKSFDQPILFPTIPGSKSYPQPNDPPWRTRSHEFEALERTFNLAAPLIENQDGVTVLDPHGDLIDQILGCIPEDRINDVVLVDLVDEKFPVGFNLLEAQTETERRLLASDLVGLFRRMSRTWGEAPTSTTNSPGSPAGRSATSSNGLPSAPLFRIGCTTTTWS